MPTGIKIEKGQCFLMTLHQRIYNILIPKELKSSIASIGDIGNTPGQDDRTIELSELVVRND